MKKREALFRKEKRDGRQAARRKCCHSTGLKSKLHVEQPAFLRGGRKCSCPFNFNIFYQSPLPVFLSPQCRLSLLETMDCIHSVQPTSPSERLAGSTGLESYLSIQFSICQYANICRTRPTRLEQNTLKQAYAETSQDKRLRQQYN